MKIISAVIVDDEEFAVIDIREHLDAYSNVEVMATFPDGIQCPREPRIPVSR